MSKENFNPEGISPDAKIVEGSVPFKDITGWVHAFKKEGMSEEELRVMLKKLNVTDYIDEEKPKAKINIDINDAEGWRNALIEAGVPREESENIINKIVKERIEQDRPREIKIEQNTSKGTEIETKR
ncbi:MAG: hypothetical protein COU46_03490 [Candidatus Niyogibacteria bacterium CG10_big_fil_rev_8_21_14_0_10_42_19]|uniref:Uncharacterized protein n=1 Tax=Candidatus Niyogibacteria bacterium CG10_big_fil_rev_8_21_14_0_10_42_19 TaxID=1974725 RepID=A0A2H0TER7_9BACT|nr:MAG: hypothetical protein COU46_03490 [Candidatus Niyogibacteria bacterium CG10_big_fil_rev_8_21_14_0_10_42_19]